MYRRRQVISALGVGVIGSVAGCSGGESGSQGNGSGSGSQGNGSGSGSQGNGSGSGSQGNGREWIKEAKKIKFEKNWKKRRITSAKDWSMEDRMDMAPIDSPRDWEGRASIENGPWSPPKGWKNTIASDVDKIQLLNHGSLDYDPATVALKYAFKRETGIEMEYLQIPSDVARTKKRALLAAEEGNPQLMDTFPTTEAGSHLVAGHFDISDPLAPPEMKKMWEPYQSAAHDISYPSAWKNFNGRHLLGAPKILEGSMLHIRPDLMKKQDIDPTPFLEGNHTWDHLEKAMKAFKGTDVAGYAFYGQPPGFVNINFMEMLYEQGGRIINDDGKVILNDPPSVRTTKKCVEWIDKGLVPNDVLSFGQGDLADLFLRGKVAIVPVYGDLHPSAREKYPKKEQYMPTIMPKATNGPKPAHAGHYQMQNLAINKYASPAKKVAALLYGDLRMSYEASWYEYVREGNFAIVDQVYEDAADKKADSKVLQDAISRNVAEFVPLGNDVMLKLGEEIMAALNQEKKPQEAHDAAQEYVNTILKQ